MDFASRKPVAWWLARCCALGVFEWWWSAGDAPDPFRSLECGVATAQGTLPPLSDSDWHELFVKYQATPQYRKVIADVADEFKGSSGGRVTGARRLTNCVLFCLFSISCARRIDRRWDGNLAGIFALGARQGVMGWYMVMTASPHPRVSTTGDCSPRIALPSMRNVWTALDCCIRPGSFRKAGAAVVPLRGRADRARFLLMALSAVS